MAVQKPLVIIAGQVQQIPAGDTLSTGGGAASTDPILSSVSGTLATLTGTARYYPPTDTTITGVYFSLGSPSSSGNVTIDIKKNGTSIMGGSYPTVAAGEYKSNAVAISVAVTTSDYLTLDITGAGTGAADMTAWLTK